MTTTLPRRGVWLVLASLSVILLCTEASADEKWGFGGADSTAPANDVLDVLTSPGERASKGAATAPITIVEFSDFQCPYCARAAKTMDDLVTRYPGEVRYVYRHLPLSFHDQARNQAIAAEAAHLQGAFWAMHDYLFEHQSELGAEPNYVRVAETIGLDTKLFQADMASNAVIDRVDADIAWAAELGLSGTPAFMLNGHKLSGAQPLDVFVAAVERELSRVPAAEAEAKARSLPVTRVLTEFNLAETPTHPAPVSEDNYRYVPIDDAPLRSGPETALLTLVSFIDFGDPGSATALAEIDALQRLYASEMRVVHNPFAHGLDPGNAFLNAAIAKSGASASKVAACLSAATEARIASCGDQPCLHRVDEMKSKVTAELTACGLATDMLDSIGDDDLAAVDAARARARVAGVSGAAGFFVNGYPIGGTGAIAQMDETFGKAQALAETIGRKGLYEKGTLVASSTADRVNVDVTGLTSVGSDEALVTVVEFTDFECPFCARAAPTMADLAQEYQGKIRIVYANLPLSFHSNARDAAKAAWAAGEQNNYLPYRELLFAHQKELSPSLYTELAEELGLDLTRFERDFTSAKADTAVDDDLALARKVGARGTPAFFINGRLLSGAQPKTKFATMIDEELAQAELLSDLVPPKTSYYEFIVARGASGVGAAPVYGPVAADAGRAYIDLTDRPIRGKKNALVTIVEATDFQCPFCVRVQPTLKQIEDHYGKDVRFSVVHRPLAFHKQAAAAAQATWAAHQQGKYWEFADALWSDTDITRDQRFADVAESLGLDMARFEADSASPEAAASVAADDALAQALGASGTPSFFVNGEKLSGAQPFAKFQEVIDRELASAKKLVDAGTRPADVYDEVTKGVVFHPHPKRRAKAKGMPALGKRSKKGHQVALFVDPTNPRAADALVAFKALVDHPNRPKNLHLALVPVVRDGDSASEEAARALVAAKTLENALALAQELNQRQGSSDVRGAADAVGLDGEKLLKRMKKAAKSVDRAQGEMQGLDVMGDPTFLVDGVAIRDLPSGATLASWVGVR